MKPRGVGSGLGGLVGGVGVGVGGVGGEVDYRWEVLIDPGL